MNRKNKMNENKRRRKRKNKSIICIFGSEALCGGLRLRSKPQLHPSTPHGPLSIASGWGKQPSHPSPPDTHTHTQEGRNKNRSETRHVLTRNNGNKKGKK